MSSSKKEKKKIQRWSPESPAAVLALELLRHVAVRFPLDNRGKQADVQPRKTSLFGKGDYGRNHTRLDQTPWPWLHGRRLEMKKTRPWVAKSADSRGEKSAYACSLCDKKWDGGRAIKTVWDKRELIQTCRPTWLRG